jgi:hypothetical protein
MVICPRRTLTELAARVGAEGCGVDVGGWSVDVGDGDEVGDGVRVSVDSGCGDAVGEDVFGSISVRDGKGDWVVWKCDDPRVAVGASVMVASIR